MKAYTADFDSELLLECIRLSATNADPASKSGSLQIKLNGEVIKLLEEYNKLLAHLGLIKREVLDLHRLDKSYQNNRPHNYGAKLDAEYFSSIMYHIDELCKLTSNEPL